MKLLCASARTQKRKTPLPLENKNSTPRSNGPAETRAEEVGGSSLKLHTHGAQKTEWPRPAWQWQTDSGTKLPGMACQL